MFNVILSTIALILIILGSFTIGYFVGKPLNSRIKTIKLNDDNEIYVWKGFIYPDVTYIYHNHCGNLEDGVVFDKKGNIIFINKNAEEE